MPTFKDRLDEIGRLVLDEDPDGDDLFEEDENPDALAGGGSFHGYRDVYGLVRAQLDEDSMCWTPVGEDRFDGYGGDWGLGTACAEVAVDRAAGTCTFTIDLGLICPSARRGALARFFRRRNSRLITRGFALGEDSRVRFVLDRPLTPTPDDPVTEAIDRAFVTCVVYVDDITAIICGAEPWEIENGDFRAPDTPEPGAAKQDEKQDEGPDDSDLADLLSQLFS